MVFAADQAQHDQEQAAREAGVGRVHDEILALVVEEDTGDGARNGDGGFLRKAFFGFMPFRYKRYAVSV